MTTIIKIDTFVDYNTGVWFLFCCFGLLDPGNNIELYRYTNREKQLA